VAVTEPPDYHRIPQVNFLSHAAVSRWYTADPRSALGAMLPDLLSMSGARWVGSPNSAILWGERLHHDTDAGFHSAPTFRRLLATETGHLRSIGLARGPSAAAAHVGIELLLDQYLARSLTVQEAFWEALSMGTNRTRLRLLWASPDDAQRFEQLRQRLVQIGRPNGTASSPRTVERITWTLRGRPQLRLAEGDAEVLVGWVDGLPHRLVTEWEALLSELQTSLADRGWPRPLPLV
jgi:hypothetical protein